MIDLPKEFVEALSRLTWEEWKASVKAVLDRAISVETPFGTLAYVPHPLWEGFQK